ncbi:uncharacterized protein QC763_206930 [Podospora pseudopauciseta]|uniref:Uncharacterized protein n=1 Tax=Podospora pseudopauciseta TaxID=2093780 RepID=A0ABR0HPM3_9PEZI|nr:hypothetical protein QC763_206930 [Podospora pseudopauciseta]
MDPRKYDPLHTIEETNPESRRNRHDMYHHHSIKKSIWAKLSQTCIFEFLGFLASFLCIGATATLLRWYDNQLAPDWPVTLNFVLSLLGNVGFAGTIFGVQATIAQLKWIWFAKRPRPLADLVGFQKARGGVIGVAQLLWTAGAEFVVITASLALLFGMFWGPFTQNLVRYEAGDIAADGAVALLSLSIVYDAHGLRRDYSTNYPDPALELNIMLALNSGLTQGTNSPQFLCSTGNCTWPPTATLGFCSRCTDITSKINLTCKDDGGGQGIPKGVYCSAELFDGSATLRQVGNLTTVEDFMNITFVGGKGGLRYHAIRLLPPYVLSSAYRPSLDFSNFSATECSLQQCVLSFETSVQNGVYTETLLDTFTEPPLNGKHWLAHQLRPPWGLERGIDPAANLSFGLSESLQRDWAWPDPHFLVTDVIPGSATTSDGHTAIEFCSGFANGSCKQSKMMNYIFNANYTANECGSVNGDTFSCVMDGIAAAMTKTIRNSGVVANGTEIGEAFLVKGQASTVATFVRVRWYWIALPAAVWTLGFVAWVVAVIRTKRLQLPTCREDLLPLLFLYDR